VIQTKRWRAISAQWFEVFSVSLRITGPHHFRGHSGDQASRREALPFFHQAIHEAGNYVGLPCCLRFESHASHFLRRLRIFESAVGLVRDFLKFRHG
jgi:hypothetical protein